MSQYVKVVDDQVMIVEEIVSRTVSLKDWSDRLAKQNPPTVSMSLPPETLFVHVSGNKVLIVTAHAPSVRTIQHRDPDEATTTVYKLAMPWVVFMHAFDLHGTSSSHDETKLFFANKRPDSWDTYVDTPPLHNVNSSDGWVCLGDTFRLDMTLTVAQKVAAIETHFWTAPFNKDLGDHVGGYRWRQVGGNYRSWQARTRRSQKFILQSSWSNNSLRYYADKFIGEAPESAIVI